MLRGQVADLAEGFNVTQLLQLQQVSRIEEFRSGCYKGVVKVTFTALRILAKKVRN